MWVSADDGSLLCCQLGEGRCPSVQRRVHENDLVVAARAAMTEDHRSEPVHVLYERVRKVVEELHVLVAQLRRGPGRDVRPASRPSRAGVARPAHDQRCP